VTTIIYNRVKRIQINEPDGDLHAYQAAQWGSFAFGILGQCYSCYSLNNPSLTFL